MKYSQDRIKMKIQFEHKVPLDGSQYVKGQSCRTMAISVWLHKTRKFCYNCQHFRNDENAIFNLFSCF